MYKSVYIQTDFVRQLTLNINIQQVRPMYIDRAIKPQLLDSLLHSNKVTMLYGPRQSGKTTLSREGARSGTPPMPYLISVMARV